jgi:hypothetical protein
MAFFKSLFLTMMQHTNTLRRFCIALCVGGKEEGGKLYKFFKEMQLQELYPWENVCPPTSNLLWKRGTEIFHFFLIMRNPSVPNFCKSFDLGQFYIIMWLLLQICFPFPVSGKVFLYSILIFSTIWSMAPIKCHAVVPYQITNIYSVMTITVMVFV